MAGTKVITNPTGAFGYTDLETQVGATTFDFVATTNMVGPRCVAVNTTGTAVAVAATDGTASLVVGIYQQASALAGAVVQVVTGGIAENVPCNGAVAAGDLLKRSVTTAGYVAATATPAVGEVVGTAINASASNVVDVWVRPGALS